MRILFYIVVLLLPHLENGGRHSFLRNTNLLAHAQEDVLRTFWFQIKCLLRCLSEPQHVCLSVNFLMQR